MKRIIYLMLITLPVVSFGQVQMRSVLSSSGNSTSITIENNEYYISSTVGQQGTIGTFVRKGLAIRQGFEQPLIRIIPLNNISEEEGVLDLIVYPNPTTNYVEVSFQQPTSGLIQRQIFDTLGRMIVNETTSVSGDFRIDTSALQSGIYILLINSEGKTFTTRLIKN